MKESLPEKSNRFQVLCEFALCLLAACFIVGGAYLDLSYRQQAMERMVGHPVSKWDVFIAR